MLDINTPYSVLSKQFRGRYEITITFPTLSLRPLMPITILRCNSYFFTTASLAAKKGLTLCGKLSRMSRWNISLMAI